jgi:nitrogen fixation protein FixH
MYIYMAFSTFNSFITTSIKNKLIKSTSAVISYSGNVIETSYTDTFKRKLQKHLISATVVYAFIEY